MSDVLEAPLGDQKAMDGFLGVRSGPQGLEAGSEENIQIQIRLA